MSLRDPKLLRTLATVVLCGLAGWAYFLSDLLPFGYPKRAAQMKTLQTKHESVSAELEKARRSVGNLPQLEAEQRELERKWTQAEALLPSDREVAQLLTQVTQAGEQAGVEFETFKPNAPRPQEFYNENPVEIQVHGGFHQIGVFLARIANLPRIVNVGELKLNGNDSGSAGKPKVKGRRPRTPGDRENAGTVTASFTATAYSLRDVLAEPQAPPAENPAKAGAARNGRNANASSGIAPPKLGTPAKVRALGKAKPPAPVEGDQ